MAAKAALIKIRQEPLQPHIDELWDTSDCIKWYPKALLVGQFGTNAVAAVPVLIAALNPTNNDIVIGHALITLGEIHCRPDLCIPAIIPFLKSPSVSSRQKAMGALYGFGSDASNATKEIRASFSDSDPYTAMIARRTLKHVNPQAAKQTEDGQASIK